MAKARAPQQIALLYALIGCLWILFSDQLVALIWQEPQTVLLVSQLKGWGYVVVTALLFYWLIRRSTERLVASESELREHSAALASADSLLRSQLAEVEGSRQRLHVLNQQLQASHQLYSDLVNSIDGIVWELEIETFRFTFVSKKAEKLLGYPVDQWLNEADFWTNHLHPGDRTWAFDFCLQATQAKRNHTFEYRFLANDGRIIWLRDVVTVVVENDRPVKLRGVMLDVTEKKQADEALKAREILLNTVLDTLPVGVWIADRQGELIRANQAAEQFKLVA
ncbi:MAG TPA: PAS domain-containing protein, partial [Geobacteraceae bacterium]